MNRKIRRKQNRYSISQLTMIILISFITLVLSPYQLADRRVEVSIPEIFVVQSYQGTGSHTWLNLLVPDSINNLTSEILIDVYDTGKKNARKEPSELWLDWEGAQFDSTIGQTDTYGTWNLLIRQAHKTQVPGRSIHAFMVLGELFLEVKERCNFISLSTAATAKLSKPMLTILDGIQVKEDIDKIPDEILCMILTDNELHKHLAPELSERNPILVAETFVGPDHNLSSLPFAVKIISQPTSDQRGQVLRFHAYEEVADTASVRFSYPIQGLWGEYKFTKTSVGWQLYNRDLSHY